MVSLMLPYALRLKFFGLDLMRVMSLRKFSRPKMPSSITLT